MVHQRLWACLHQLGGESISSVGTRDGTADTIEVLQSGGANRVTAWSESIAWELGALAHVVDCGEPVSSKASPCRSPPRPREMRTPNFDAGTVRGENL